MNRSKGHEGQYKMVKCKCNWSPGSRRDSN